VAEFLQHSMNTTASPTGPDALEAAMLDTYPARGKKFEIDFGEDGPFGPFAADLSISDRDDTLTFLVTRGSLLDKSETCEFHATAVCDDIWMVSWREADGLTVVQVQDFAQGKVRSAVTTPENDLVYLEGTLRFL